MELHDYDTITLSSLNKRSIYPLKETLRVQHKDVLSSVIAFFKLTTANNLQPGNIEFVLVVTLFLFYSCLWKSDCHGEKDEGFPAYAGF